MINCITRNEHSEAFITDKTTIEAIRTARIASHIVDLSRNVTEAKKYDMYITNKRVKNHCCFADGTMCNRCSIVCPLKLNRND